MKRVAFIFTALTAVAIRAQSLLPVPNPALQVIPSPALPQPSPTLPILATPGNNNSLSLITTVSPQSLPVLLTNLQVAVEQTLPVLAAVNDSFDFVSLGSNGIAQLVPDTGTNAFGSPNLMSAFTASVPSPSSVVGTLVTSAATQTTLTRSQVQQLLIIQNDLERLLPLLSALNGLAPATNTLSPR
jgi:hypothetical protein